MSSQPIYSLNRTLLETGYAMAGIPEGLKIKTLSTETYAAVYAHADEELVETNGSKHMPLKFAEPVIPVNAERIVVVVGLNAIGQKVKNVCHRPELNK